jgi:hypothetical protein
MKLLALCLFAAAGPLLLNSCSTYVTPGGRADFSTFTEPGLKKAYQARPAAKFPAHLVVTRVQDSGYRSYSSNSYGRGKYSVITQRDLERDEDIDRITALPGIAQVGMLNRLLLPNSLGSDLELRQAAAKLHADLLLIYTLDTSLADRDLLPPLTTISLGLSPTKKYTVTSTAAALLMDARTGYVYGVLEETGERKGVAMAWGSRETMDAARIKAERDAFEKLLNAFEPFWKRVYQRHR